MDWVKDCMKVYCHGLVLLSSLLALGILQVMCYTSCTEAPRDVEPSHVRIVSLSPALTRTLEDLGLEEAVVGCTPFCNPQNSQAVVVGDLREIDYELLVRLRPSHVLVQVTAAGLRPELIDLAQTRGWSVDSWPTDDLDDIRTLLIELPSALGGSGQQRAQRLLSGLDAIGGEPTWLGRTLIVTGGQPLLAFGPETYLGQLLTRFGVPNALEQGAWQTLSAEDVVRLDPEGIIVIGSAQGQAREVVEALPIAAVSQGGVVVLDHPEALVPSSRVLEVAADLRELLQQLALARMQMSAIDE